MMEDKSSWDKYIYVECD